MTANSGSFSGTKRDFLPEIYILLLYLRSRRRLEKKSGAGAGKKLAGSSALREDKKHKEIVL